ncbi:MAG: phosphate ABC transporter substrate-binding protein [Syntrophales bacterium]|nr:phosphate ABC transporter substrate-binding protein [Syntrophales bacterium]
MKKKVLCFMVASAILLGFTSLSVGKTNIVIKGSTTVLPIAQKLLEAYTSKHPDVNISLSGGGSGDGIKALIDGMTDIANSSREIKPEEEAKAREKNVTPLAHVVAYDAIVPIVHPKNKIKDLSLDQLSQIYQGKITNWKEVGGEDLEIVVVSRDSSSGTFESWGHLVLKGARVTPKAQMQASNGAVVQTVAKNKYAIGYIGLGYINKSVKPLSVNGIAATVETARSGQYPISRPLYMYTNGEPKDAVASFIKFALSNEGQALVESVGFVPVKKIAAPTKKKK